MGFSDVTKLASMIAKLLEDGMTLPAQEKIVELRKKLISLENDYLDLLQENRDLKEKLKNKEEFIFDEGIYWSLTDDGSKDGMWCPRCHDKDGKACRMNKTSHYYVCASCGCQVQHTPLQRIQQLRFSPRRW